METLGLRIIYTAVEAVLAGVALGGVLVLVRNIQLAFGVKDDKADGKVHLSGAR